MRLVIDTNVVFSGLMYGGKPFELLELVATERAAAFTSPWLLLELRGILERPRHAARLSQLGRRAAEIADRYAALTTPIEPAPLTTPVCRDPDDDAVLACALAAQADLIVSGDHDLRVLVHFEGIAIVSASDAIDRLRAAQ